MSHFGREYVRDTRVGGHVRAFALFGAATLSIVYDNDRCLVTKILPDGTHGRATLFIVNRIVDDKSTAR